MQVLITGGSGFIGQALCPALLAAGWQVSVVSRDTRAAARKLPPAVRVLADIDGASGADAVINLAGAPLAGRRWNAAYKQTLRESRLRTTEALLAWMESLTVRPAVLISGSAIGYYGPSDDTPLAETAPAGDDFAARLAADWEAAALPARALSLTVSCDGPTPFALVMHDNRAGSATGGIDETAYGLGLDARGQKVGRYYLLVDPARASADNLPQLYRTDSTTGAPPGAAPAPARSPWARAASSGLPPRPAAPKARMPCKTSAHYSA